MTIIAVKKKKILENELGILKAGEIKAPIY